MGQNVNRKMIPNGWDDYVHERSSDVDWLVLIRA